MQVSHTSKPVLLSVTIALALASGVLANPAAASDPGGCGVVIQMCDGVLSPDAGFGGPGWNAAPRGYESHGRPLHARKHHGHKHRRH